MLNNTRGSARDAFGRALRVFVSAALAACLVPAAHASSVLAASGDIFSAAGGTTSGSEVSCGTELTFKILEQPTGSQPGTAQVGSGSALAVDASYAGTVTIPEYVEHDGASYKVTVCGEGAFKNTKINSVVLPDSVVTIGKQAFYGCTSLTAASVGKSSALENIYTEAFCMPASNGALESFYFPASVTWVGSNSFEGQVKLKQIEFAGNYIGYLGKYAFASCNSLTEAEIPGITADGVGLDYLSFANCVNLTKVVFKGSVLKEAKGAALDGDLTQGTRTFDGCSKLATVVYRAKKYIPSWGRYTGGGSGSGNSFGDADPTLYTSVVYYATKADAERGANALGAVCVRDDTLLSSVKPGMATSDSKGAVVYDGLPVALPSGYTGWAYEGNAKLTEPVSDSLYAYPVNASDISYATFNLDQESYSFAAAPIAPQSSMTDASGNVLTQGVEYQVSYERKQGDVWVATEDLESVGELRAVATAVAGSGYTGTVYAPFSIVEAAEGSAFVKDGVTYSITAAAKVGKPGAVAVGDGSELAVAADYAGGLTIPASVAPQGSLLEYRVTSIADYAFGGASEAKAVTGLTGVSLPETLEGTGTYSFGYCTGLKSLVVPASVKEIGSRSFDHCRSLSALEFAGSEIEMLGTYAFASCTALKSVKLPSIAASRDHVFANCTVLARVEFEGSFPDEDMPTRFAGCKRLSRIVCYAQAYPDTTESNASVYYAVAFNNAAGAALGTALIKAGTRLAALSGKLGSAQLLEGKVPALPSGYKSWVAASGSVAKVSKPLTVKPSKIASSSSVATINAKKVTAKVLAKVAKATTVVLGSKVSSISAKAFKKTSVTTLEIKTSKLSAKSTASCLKGSKVSKVVLKGAAKKKLSLYKKCFAKSNSGKKVTVR